MCHCHTLYRPDMQKECFHYRMLYMEQVTKTWNIWKKKEKKNVKKIKYVYRFLGVFYYFIPTTRKNNIRQIPFDAFFCSYKLYWAGFLVSSPFYLPHLIFISYNFVFAIFFYSASFIAPLSHIRHTKRIFYFKYLH